MTGTNAENLVHAFFTAVAAGDLPDSLLTPDMTGWITTQGAMDKASYQGLIRLLARMTNGPLHFVVDSITAQEDRIVAEARSTGRLIDGTDYAQTYVYVFRVREGRIASVAEHYNALIAQEKLLPLMKALRET
ncbi:nuclear transport factor 2 family protein [Novosphingobium beihaiensis]|uniref:Nuclear transport factor 2 family protein n=1 Tax=Novosphingobium beihaiensis TaxID=2930389 RepID=A0ABT0BKZ9_9SPHN|nr:nuclear transport factor 2 family protein [Novosphingobium beihaiensis]MCJ2185736.1 nuclear transport factor 2 family protein [Novosphingobium beihaiensis]